MAIITLYKITNCVNGHFYIGCTTKKLKRRWNEHTCAARKGETACKLWAAMREHGIESFAIEEIEAVSTIEEGHAREMALIAELTPSYNTTLGGAGVKGFASYGHLGKKHSEETKALLSDLGHKNIDKFKQYAHLGPASRARKVICLETNEVFESTGAAARHYGISRSMIVELCNGNPRRKTAKGMRFKYVGDE